MNAFKLSSLALLLGVLASTAFAQRADHKITGDAFRGHQAQTYQRHARDSAQMLYYEGRYQPQVNAQDTKPHVAGVRSNVAAANKALDKIKESNAAKPGVGKAVDKIKERHAKALAKCEELDKHLADSGKDASAMCDCCMEIIDELDGAAADTNKLLKDLKADALPKLVKSSEKDAPAKK